MSKTWYPEIHREECSDCGACFRKCSHGVFKLEGKVSVVVNPEGCDQGCHGCGNLCPKGAITYIGENTEWIPPAKKKQMEELGISCSCGESL